MNYEHIFLGFLIGMVHGALFSQIIIWGRRRQDDRMEKYVNTGASADDHEDHSGVI